MPQETRPGKWVFLHDLEHATQRVVAASNGHEPLDLNNHVIYHGLKEARTAATEAGMLTIKYEQHLNGARNNRSIVHDAEGGRTIMEVFAGFTEEDSVRGQALRDIHLTPDVIYEATVALFGEPEAPGE